jgi:hypothetical protein
VLHRFAQLFLPLPQRDDAVVAVDVGVGVGTQHEHVADDDVGGGKWQRRRC